jgi:hypothetical protein
MMMPLAGFLLLPKGSDEFAQHSATSNGEPRQQKCDPENPVDRQGPGYDNEVPVSSWLLGGHGDVTRMPGFDHSRPPTKIRK